MAFDPDNWGVISDSGSLGASTLQDGSVVGAPAIFTYQSATETQATIAAANYFSPVANTLSVNDLLEVVASDGFQDYTIATVNYETLAVTITANTGTGDVNGPASSTNTALVRWNGVTGKLIEDGTILEDGSGNLTLVNSIANGAGLIGTPSYTFTGDLDTGMWHSAANTVDFSTNALRAFQLTAAPALSVNWLAVAPSATTNAPNLSALGTDTNIGIRLIPKGTGAVLNSAGATATPSYSFSGNVGTGMWSSAGGVLDFSAGALRGFQVDTSPAVAVDYLSAISAASTTIGLPLLQAKGADTNIDVGILPKGTGGLSVRGATNAGSLKLWNQANTFYAQISAGVMASSINWVWPIVDGAAGQSMVTDGAGVLSFANAQSETWIDQTSTPVTLVANSSYVADNAGLVTFNMPATVAFGTVFEIAGKGSGGWLVQMNTGQVVNMGSSPSSSAGSLASTNRYDCIKILCVTANTTFVVTQSMGNITVA